MIYLAKTMGMGWLLMLAIALQAASFSSTGQGDVKHYVGQSQNPVTSMSILVRRIIRTKGNVSRRVSKKNETSKMKFKRRRTRKLKEKLRSKSNKTANLNSDLQFVRNIVNMTEQADYITETPEDPYNDTKAVTSTQPRKPKTNSYTWNKLARASLANETEIKYKPKNRRNIRKKTKQRSSSTTPPMIRTTTVLIDREPKTSAEINYIAMRRNIKYRNKDSTIFTVTATAMKTSPTTILTSTKTSSTTTAAMKTTTTTTTSTTTSTSTTTTTSTTTSTSTTTTTSTTTKTSNTTTTSTTTTASTTTTTTMTTSTTTKTTTTITTTNKSTPTSTITPAMKTPSESLVHESPRSIINLIDNKFVQLNSELDLLLEFNENLLHFDISIVKKAAKNKVEEFMKTLSTVIDTETERDGKLCRESRMINLKAASKILAATADISRTLGSTLSVGSMTSIQLPNISMLVMKKQMGQNTTSDWLAGDIKVTLPDQPSIAQDDSSVTVSFTSYHNLGYMMSVEDEIRSPVLSVNVIKTKNLKKSIPLTKPVEFLLHHKPIKEVSQRKCVYWDFETSSWSRDGCFAIRKKSTLTTTLCQCYHLTNFALSVEQEDAKATTEAATVARKHSWDTLAYFSAEPSVTPEPGYVEEVVKEEEHNVITATKKASNDLKYFIVSAPPRILKLESLLKKQNNNETIPESKTNKSVFIEFAELKVKTVESSNPDVKELPVSYYEDFLASDELDETINLGRRDNDSEDMWEKIEDIDNNDFTETLAIKTIDALHTIDISEKSQPLTILKTEERMFNTTSTMEVMKGNVSEVNPLLSTDSLAVGIIIIGCSLLVLCLCVCWSQHRRKMGKLSLVGGCSSIAGFDGSVGSVSSMQSLYSQDLSDSFDSISGDNFRSSLEDEM